MRLLAIALVTVLLALQLSATPTVYHCLFTEGWAWRFTGKAHCELQGWRHVLRGTP